MRHLALRRRPLAERWQARKGQNDAEQLVYTMLREDVADPYRWAIDLIKDEMAQRGLLTVVEEKKLKILTVRHYELPPATAQRGCNTPPQQTSPRSRAVSDDQT